MCIFPKRGFRSDDVSCLKSDVRLPHTERYLLPSYLHDRGESVFLHPTPPQFSLSFSFSTMRIPLSTSLVALAISGALAHIPQSPSQGRVRKSLGFGPEIPHAVFNTSPEQLVQGFSSNPASSPFEVAESFVAQLLRKDSHFSDHSTYTVRSDSYTDDNTGVTHVYFRQLINGIEVSDGLMNVNVKDGVILSYGDSVSYTPFYFHIIIGG